MKLVAKIIERKDQENRARLAELVEVAGPPLVPGNRSDAPRIGARLFNSARGNFSAAIPTFPSTMHRTDAGAVASFRLNCGRVIR